MFNYFFKLFSRVFTWRREIRPKRKRGYIIPCYFIAVFTIIFQCLFIRPLSVEGNEVAKFSCDSLDFRYGLTKSGEQTLIPILSNRIQAFQFSQYFAPKFDRSFCNPVFSVVTVSNVTDKAGKQNSTQNGVDVVNNDFHLFGLPWWVWFIIIIFILTQQLLYPMGIYCFHGGNIAYLSKKRK